MKTRLPAFDEDQLIEIATRETAAIANEHDREDAKQEFILGALEAQAKARKGEAVRAFQWESARGRVLNFLNRDKHGRNQEKRVKVILDSQVGDEGEEEALVNFMASAAARPLDLALDNERAARVRSAVHKLPEDLREVIKGRFFQHKTLEEIAKARKVTKEWIRKLEAEALRILRAKLARVA